MERVHVIIHGRVQGVFFRAFTRKEAHRLGLSGFVRNRPDGTVEAVAEGPRHALEQFVLWCHHGPQLSRVDRVEVSWEPHAGAFHGFDLG
jgi:acylphosphatase